MSRLVPASPFSSVNPTEAPSFVGGFGRTTVNTLRASGRFVVVSPAPVCIEACKPTHAWTLTLAEWKIRAPATPGHRQLSWQPCCAMSTICRCSFAHGTR